MTEDVIDRKKLIIKTVLKALFAVALAFVVSFAAFSRRGYGWFASNNSVTGDGMGVSIKESKGASFDGAFAGNFKLNGDEINLNISDRLTLYPQNYITVVFSVVKEIEDFAIDVQEYKLTAEQFDERFDKRRDLLLGTYYTNPMCTNYYDVEQVFPYAAYSGGGYAQFVSDSTPSLPMRPEISMTGDEWIFNSAYTKYFENSLPYLKDMLYRFSESNHIYDALTFSLYVIDRTEATPTTTRYLLIETKDADLNNDGVPDGKKFTPEYKQVAVGDGEFGGWTAIGESEKVKLELSDGDKYTYALVLGYGTEVYTEADGTTPKQPLIPSVTIDGDESSATYNAALNEQFSVPTGGQTVSPYAGTFYSDTYNCFIGCTLAVKFA